ncbi:MULTISPECIES: 6,7-dimethyl-8-ribityllumazine synthase [Saccharibacter]|uniref:6,7-dimethyl-8-ribityllumazine synthase n=1 Tax=Saccharibacter floricola DSM 15669 TaxID=1123227 RepID=A0ABQ0NWU1_9PROT|nr:MULTISPECIES: 6,7-dimethyl-8-ribityllumazine synthase [Saccharibacter]MXV36465.1 6,7-dimethyl-8-ribityllumazine synthase [Saccharibacter sp. EH611]MXV57627.1 6,7-dimethyl-8-ribityllumazine synthase [Saccharibacter sp. EH70]MXV65066.1 6,7-dimethyl-8-ribityllumazine synthase [Saccharibacter sp. EH60]GBQ05065.1 6,7-dimethyl-8-ribityllumazine synthase [Saccharibacter floricola DSM 15669]
MSKHIATAPEGLILSPSPKIALVVSRFNTDVTGGLKKGALAWLSEHHIDSVDCYDAPGAFELPIMAQRLAQTGRYEGVICLGCVIKGDTAHFEFISLGATVGLMQAQLAAETPISFGILTTYSEEQAVLRSRDDAHNKGREAAAACVETVSFLRETPKS